MKKERMKWFGFGVVLSVEACTMVFMTGLTAYAAKASFEKAFKKEGK